MRRSRRPRGRRGRGSGISSRMASEIRSQILSGWPSVTDSEVNRRCFAIFVPPWRWGVCIDIDSFLLVHQVYAMKTLRTEALSVALFIFRFPAGFGTLCSHTGCRASQGLSPQPLLISRYSVCPDNILSLPRRNVKKSRTLFDISRRSIRLNSPLPARRSGA